MKAQDLQRLLENGNLITPEHIVYEANDEAMLISFSIEKSGKMYHSKATIDWSGLNWVIAQCAKAGFDVYDELSGRLFDSYERIREYSFKDMIWNLEKDQQQAA
ncbi:MAG: hypothetical protein H6598_01140 [Flavobacteriales bacterium]|nr:hypothetical protein [Flavobacteriales bacterium]